jgi:hypothetical protein
VFHVELRQFPHVARAFNLTEEQLEARIVAPWVRGNTVRLDDRSWSPERARLKIYDGPELRPDEIGLGRGWASVTRTGTEVTAELLAEAAGPSTEGLTVEALKSELEAQCAAGRISVADVPSLVEDRHAALRASQRLALAEQAVWELLHQGRVRMLRGDAVLGPEEWEPILLAWGTWTDATSAEIQLEALPQPD